MNWLLYIGGFFPFWLIFINIINIFRADVMTEGNSVSANISSAILYIICPSSIWVWICFKFIN